MSQISSSPVRCNSAFYNHTSAGGDYVTRRTHQQSERAQTRTWTRGRGERQEGLPREEILGEVMCNTAKGAE